MSFRIFEPHPPSCMLLLIRTAHLQRGFRALPRQLLRRPPSKARLRLRPMQRPMLRPLSLCRGTLDSCAGAMKNLRAGPIMGGKGWWHGRGGRGAREDALYAVRASEGSGGRARGEGGGGIWLVDVLTSASVESVNGFRH